MRLLSFSPLSILFSFLTAERSNARVVRNCYIFRKNLNVSEMQTTDMDDQVIYLNGALKEKLLVLSFSFIFFPKK